MRAHRFKCLPQFTLHAILAAIFSKTWHTRVSKLVVTVNFLDSNEIDQRSKTRSKYDVIGGFRSNVHQITAAKRRVFKYVHTAQMFHGKSECSTSGSAARFRDFPNSKFLYRGAYHDTR